MEFRVTYADGEVVEGIKLIPSARRAVEATYQKPFLEVTQSKFSDWCDLVVWTFLKVRMGEERDLDEWLETVDGIELATAAEPGPTSGTGRKRSASSKQRSTKAKTSTA